MPMCQKFTLHENEEMQMRKAEVLDIIFSFAITGNTCDTRLCETYDLY